MRNALLSAFNKEGIVHFAASLVLNGWNIYSSGGTAKKLTENNIPVIDIADLVGKPILGHKVVTLSRPIMSGLLADMNSPEDVKEMEENHYPVFDLVYVDLYPLTAAIAAKDATPASVLMFTDIGGPTMLRAAAKGFRYVLMESCELSPFIKWLENGEKQSQIMRIYMRAKAEKYVADYVRESARYWQDLAPNIYECLM